MKDVGLTCEGAVGVLLVGLLTIAFVVLKLIGQIDWSWAWVLAPVWGFAVVAVIVFVVVAWLWEKTRGFWE